MSIAWRDAMSVGDGSVDSDHKYVVSLINDLEAATVGHIDHKRVATVLLALFEHTAEHFQREEDIQLRVRYPYFESHRRSHRDLLRKMTGLVQDYTMANSLARDRMVRSMAGLLKEWLLEHIIQSDLRMKPYVTRWHADMAETERRKRAAIAQSEAMAGLTPRVVRPRVPA